MEFEKLKEIIVNTLGVAPDEITMDTTFVDDLGADSLDLYTIIMALEDEYDIKFEEDEVTEITTVGEAVELLKEALHTAD